MSDKSETDASIDRRTLLQGIGGVGTAAAVLGMPLYTVAAQQGNSYVVEQGGDCTPIGPLSYENQGAAEFYNYTEDENADIDPYESHNPMNMGMHDVSYLFLYRGPDGLSLGIIHDKGGHSNSENKSGGAASFTMTGLPNSGEWTVQNDNYQGDDNDTWQSNDGEYTVDWAWNYWNDDGGMFTGLGNDFEVTIEPQFNDRAELEPETEGEIERWQFVTQGEDGTRTIDLRMDEPVTIRAGTCN